MRKALFFLGILDDSDIEWMMTAGVKLDSLTVTKRC